LRKVDDDDVLWVNGDLYFEAPTARRLIEANELGSRLLVNRAVTEDEEIKYRLDTTGDVAELSKSVRDPAGESLGMQIVVRDDRSALLEQLEGVGDQDYFEQALENCIEARSIRLSVVAAGDDFCREVDYPEDLDAVRKHLRESDQR